MITMSTPVDHITELLARAPSPRDCRRLRVRWLLDMAAALDNTPIDGAADLATTARELAVAVVAETVTHVGGGAA